eukprot:GFUD01014211.1.p1 GENE.GFUD01014211.1~~GFUD01014211.1.p1  ORF type:complete len:520 (-),score=100.48 GFUD01014211.1:177-1736(-)
MSAWVSCLLVLLSSPCLVQSGKILLWCPVGSKSMKITFMPVIEQLASNGHDITLVTPFLSKEKIKGVTEIRAVSKFEDILDGFSREALKENPTVIIPPFGQMFHAALSGSNVTLNHPTMKKLLDDRSTKFDVVIAVYFLGHEVGYYLADRFNASLALYFTGQASFPTISHAMGMPHNLALHPFGALAFPLEMNFWQRTANFLVTNFFEHVLRNWYMLGRVDALLDQHFPGEPRKPLLELEKNASLSLAFGHPLIADGLRPVAPNYVFIGMMNCKDPKPLPEDLQSFMDGAEDGVIFVSFGSVLQASLMSESKRKVLVNVFGKLKQRVIWKWETETMADKPDNLKLSKWLPQQDILAHPNTKLFISHIGQSSSQETLCHGKPVVAIPINGDQPANAIDLKRMGVAEVLSWSDMNEENLLESIKTVINDPSYTEKAQKFGTLLKDQINKPIDRTIWHIEHLIRNPGLIDHMRPPVHNLTWYQYFLLDVMAFLASLLLLMTYLFYRLLRLCCRSKSKHTKEE